LRAYITTTQHTATQHTATQHTATQSIHYDKSVEIVNKFPAVIEKDIGKRRIDNQNRLVDTLRQKCRDRQQVSASTSLFVCDMTHSYV